MTIIVSGFGRCGTSLVMQMLAAGGIEITGKPPLWEDPKGNPGGFDPEYIRGLGNKAIKILDLQRPELRLPEGDYKVIWCARDYREQAKSFVKMGRQIRGEDADWRVFRASFRRNAPRAMAACKRLDPNFIRVWFEALILRPEWSAQRLAEYLHLDAGQMSQVVKKRTPRNLPYMAEVDISELMA